MTNLGAGEILPPEKLAQTKPGKILLAVEPALAENVAAILRRFGHTVLIARSAKDVFAEFGFSAVPEQKNPALTLYHAEGDTLANYSLPRAVAASASRRESLPDIVLGDMFSVGFAGFELQEMMKSCGEFVDTRVIIVSPFDESKCVARAIQLGADDYLGWDVEPSVLLARIESSIERKRLRARRQLYVAALARARESLEEELRRGAEYVRCLLPGKISGATMSTDWAFVPSANLGGDLFRLPSAGGWPHGVLHDRCKRPRRPVGPLFGDHIRRSPYRRLKGCGFRRPRLRDEGAEPCLPYGRTQQYAFHPVVRCLGRKNKDLKPRFSGKPTRGFDSSGRWSHRTEGGGHGGGRRFRCGI